MRKTKSMVRKGFTSLFIAMMITVWAGAASAYAAQDAGDVPAVVEQTTPAVVAIIGKPSTDSNSAWETNRYNLAHGTGVVVKSDGVIVTNAHVVKDMKNIVVVTADGKTYNGRTTNLDEESDLALVKIDASGLATAKFAASSSIKVGQTVAAIGTPISFALRNSVTVGIVSGLDRSVNSQYQLIQTDAAINPGNSGGALVNMNGEIIGINTMKYADFGVENLGFAIPVDTVSYVLRHFELYGKVKRPYLGIELEESWEAVVGLPSSEGLRVAYVDPDSPASKAGVKQGDAFLSLGTTTVKTMVDYNEALKKYLPDENVTLTLQAADGTTYSKQVKLGEAQGKDTKLMQDGDSSDIDADRGKVRIGDSHFGWSMKYPAGLVKGSQSKDGNSVSFMDAKGEFYLSIEVDSNKTEDLSPSVLLNKLSSSSYDTPTILERQIVKKDGQSYAKVVSKSGDSSYSQTRGYLHDGKLYVLSLLISKEQYTNKFKQNSMNDLLDSFKLSFDSKDASLKDISVFANGNTTYTNEYGLSMELPSDWTESYISDSSYMSEDYSQTVTVEVTSASSGDTLKAWVDREVKSFESGYVSKYRETGKAEELTLSGTPAIKLTTSSTMGGKWESAVAFYLIKDKYKYKVTVSYPKDKAEQAGKVVSVVASSIQIDKERMDAELGYIQDIQELVDPNHTVKFTNKTYKYTVRTPEQWTASPYGDEEGDSNEVFHFLGGSISINADDETSYEEAVEDEDDYHKKSHENDKEYVYTAEDVSLFGGSGKKYTVRYSESKVAYQETIYIFRKNDYTYTVTLTMNDAVRTPENEARLQKAFESIQFQSK